VWKPDPGQLPCTEGVLSQAPRFYLNHRGSMSFRCFSWERGRVELCEWSA
jgi:hypothetical protein